MRNLKLLAILLSLVCNAVADGWNTNAWPSETHLRITDTNNLLDIAGQIDCLRYTVDYSVSATNGIPGFSTNGFRFNGSGVDSNIDFSNYKYGINSNMWVEVGDMSDSNNFAKTIIFYTHFRGMTNGQTEIYGSGFSDNSPYTKTNSWVSDSGTITEVIDVVQTNIVYTNTFLLNSKEIRAWNCWKAYNERGPVGQISASRYRPLFMRTYNKIGAFGPVFNAGSVISPSEQYGDRYNLMTAKAAAQTTMVRSKTPVSDGFGWINTALYDPSDLSGQVNFFDFALVETNIADGLTIPTNYLTYTPYRQLDGAGIPFGKIVTNTWILSGGTSAVQVVTNSVEDYHGGARTISGTNGTEVYLLSTNIYIQAGFTELDYSWKYMTNFYAAMTLHWSERFFSEGLVSSVYTNIFEETTNTYTSWAAAKANVGESVTDTASYFGTGGTDVPAGAVTNWTAERSRTIWKLEASLFSNTNFSGTNVMYFYGRSTLGVNPPHIFNDNGFNILLTATNALLTNAFVAGTDNVATSFYGGITQIPDWIALTNVSFNREGFDLLANDVVIDYDFEYK